MLVRLVIQEVTYTVICPYAPHADLGAAEKRHFWESLDEVVRMCPPDHRLLIGGDLNGHIGTNVEGYPGAHGGFGYGVRNEEGLYILDFAIARDLVVANSFFKKTNAQGELRTCGDCKALTDLTCSSQHRLLVMDLVLQRRVTMSVRPVQPTILWKKLNGEKTETFKTLVVERVEAEAEKVSHEDADQMWNCLASAIREAAKEALGVAVGTSRGHRSDRESWWLSDEVQSKVALKQLRFRELITCREGTPVGRTRVEERYKEAKREAKKAVARAKDKEYKDLYRKLDSKEGSNDIYRIAKARERRRRDLDNIKFIKNEAGQTLVKEDKIRKRWEGYFSSFFAGGRPECPEDQQESEIEQSQNNIDFRRINHEEVRSALRKMGRNRAAGPDQITIEEELNRRLEQWRVALEGNGLQISRQKTEYLRCDFDRNTDERDDGVNICIGDQILHPQTSFRYLGSMLYKLGRIDEDVSHRIKVGWVKWRAATGVLCDRKIPLKLKGKFFKGLGCGCGSLYLGMEEWIVFILERKKNLTVAEIWPSHPSDPHSLALKIACGRRKAARRNGIQSRAAPMPTAPSRAELRKFEHEARWEWS
ncbi:uncharacterized protein [Rutidosis leptorrhynchoides]|uniref:uncharacterized protein n=1 Tax=Rutidosis leptorrhynchoides TaxID=125765 RepID=UPI003A9A3D04